MTPQEAQAQDDAFSRQYDTEQATRKADETLAPAGAVQPPLLSPWMTGSALRASIPLLDKAVSAADTMFNQPTRKTRDVAAGAVTGATNIVDTVAHAPNMALDTSAQALGMPHSPVHIDFPIWEHAKGAILDFRDAVAVKDPTLSDNLTQGIAQLAIPFAGYSRALSQVHGVANMFASGALTDATALGPHDPRMADLIALGRTTEGKFGQVLRTLTPDGSAMNAYIEYLTSRKNEGEAEGRFKNVLDGFGINLISTPILTAAASVIKQGQFALRRLADEGVGSMFDLVAPGSPAAQLGAVGVRPPLRPGVDPAEKLFEEQVRRDVDAAHRANNASGESAASLEAQNWVKAQKTSGIQRIRLDPDAEPQPLMGIEGRDPRPITGHPVIDLHPNGNYEIIERGGMTKLQADGLVASFKARKGLGSEEK